MVRLSISHNGRDVVSNCDAVLTVSKVTDGVHDHARTLFYGDASAAELLSMLGCAVGSVSEMLIDQLGISPSGASMLVLRAVAIGVVFSGGNVRIDDRAATAEIERMARSLGIDIPDGSDRR